ncbi:MAG: CPBP family intramembrane glutamic endopeptidase [Anaerolineae bacterium]
MILFVAATFVWTWVFYGIIVFSGQSPYQMPGMLWLILGGAGPSIVGIILVYLTFDPQARRDYWRRAFSTSQIGLRWWAVILLIFPTTFAISIAIDLLLGGSAPGLEQFSALMAAPLTWPLAILLSLMSGPVSEEFGWRGYALDPVLRRIGIVPGTVMLGLIWAVWHLPLYFMPETWHGQMGFVLAGFWTFLLAGIADALIMTWIYLRTERSILSAILLHFMANFTGQLLAPVTDRVEIIRVVLLLGIGLVACIRLAASNRSMTPSTA